MKLASKTLLTIHHKLDEHTQYLCVIDHDLDRLPSHLVVGIALHKQITQAGSLIPFQAQRHAITVAAYHELAPQRLMIIKEIYSARHIAHLMRWRSLTGSGAHISAMPMKLTTHQDDTAQSLTFQAGNHPPLRVTMTAPCYIRTAHHDPFLDASVRRYSSYQKNISQKSSPAASWTVQSHRTDHLAAILLPDVDLQALTVERVHCYHEPTIILSTSAPS